MSPIASEEFFADMHLSLEGIGATLKTEDDTVVIEELIPGGPAEKSKLLKPKDRIIGVGAKENKITDLVGMRLDEAVKLIRGPKGSKVFLQIQRGEGEAARIFVISLIRDKIKLTDRAAAGEVLNIDGHKVGVLKVSSFYDNLTSDAREQLEKLKKEKIESLVVDLRGNGGGLITEAAGFTGLFIEKGPVVQVRDMNNFIETVDDPSSDIMYDGPMVVLIDNLSASASEIFAAALQDYGRALIVGSNSFGKGTVQQVRSLSKFYDLFNGELGQLSYTIAKFYRINGGSTQLRGVTPDVVMPMLSDVQKYSEKELDNALPWDSIKSQKFQRVGSPAEHAQKLSIELNARIASDPAYQVTLEQIELAKKIVDKPSVSLNLDERKAKKEEDAKGELDRTNRLLKIIGQKPVENLNDVPADVKFPDPIKDQAARVALGLALQQ
jgi:carboxyl-terminal processing protease